MNHKRGRPKNRRASCKLCASNKINGAKFTSQRSGSGGPRPGRWMQEKRARVTEHEQRREA